jgi:hypothetical protein
MSYYHHDPPKLTVMKYLCHKWLVVSVLAVTLYQGYSERNQKFWNIGSTERYILHMHMLKFVIDL